MRSIIWVLIIAVVVWGTWYLFNSLESPASKSGASESGPIFIGAILPLTGDGATYGIPIKKAGQLAVEEINAIGGIAGRQIKVIWEDGQCDAKGASAAMQKLTTVDKVKYILGGVCSSEVLAIVNTAQSSQILVISPSATSPDITDAGDYIFRTAPSDALAGKIAAQYATEKLEAKTVAIISENKDYTQGLRKVFSASFEELGGEVVADEVYATGDADFSDQILKIKSADPDVIYVVPQTPTPGLAIIKELGEQKITTQLLTAEVLIGRDFIGENANDLEGLIGIEQYFNPDAQITKTFSLAFNFRFDESLAFPSFMANYYSGFYLLKEAIETVGVEPTAIKDWLYTVNGWKHALGKLTFDENGDPLAQYQIVSVEGGEINRLDLIQTK